MNPPKGVFAQIERILANFFWRGSDRHHCMSWKGLCYPYNEGGVQFRRLQDVSNAFTTKSWWNLITGTSLWKEFMLAKYCKRNHPLVTKWITGQSQQWKALCDIKYELEQNIIWLPGKGDVSFWYDNWTGPGPLYIHLPANAKPKDVKIKEVLTQGSWQLDSMGIEVPESVRDEVAQH
uniref:Uncharacterized protein LOC104228141 n=1 Tax=Nicotiana sylvestris TaxID=4096 RepID=A0A1U7WNH6_NICSY|nr:PREDICTED: uncharacterized protein LOC104228141 [Nicotiana sylvestris]